MDAARDTCALVVGADAYKDPKVPQLAGAVADAVAFANWLSNLGVPKSQIRLHAAPTATSGPVLRGWRRRRATAEAINDSIVSLAKGPPADRLIVYLAGHGIFEPTAGRLFLLPDFTPETPVNLGIDQHIQRFLSMRFRRIFLFMDGCQNLPYGKAARQRIKGMMYGGATGFTPVKGNVLVAAYAAAQEEIALEVDGHGLFTRWLLEGLSLEHPAYPDAVVLDFQTGSRALDLRELIMRYVKPQVAERTSSRQSVLFSVHPGESDGRCLFFSYPVLAKPGEINLTVQPPEAVPDVARLRVSAIASPLWTFADPMPPRTDLGVPITIRMPRGAEAEAYCLLREGAAWEGKRKHSFTVMDHQDLVFTLDPPSDPSETTIEIRPVTPSGSPALGRFSYDRITDDGALHRAHGVRFRTTEFGPTVRFKDAPDALEAGLEQASLWSDALRRTTDADVGVEMIVRTDHARLLPEVLVFPPAGGATGLAGPLANCPLVWVGSLEQVPALPLFDREVFAARPTGLHPLSELQSDGRSFQIEPGPCMVRLDLPWGSWSTVVQARTAEAQSVQLPDAVGKPPLRVRLPDLLTRRGTLLVGLTERRGAVMVSEGLSEPPAWELTDVRAGSARWAASASRVRRLTKPGSVGIATVDDFSFPLLYGRTLALDEVEGEVFIEPLSAIDVPGWDVLVVGGHLDGLSPAAAVELTYAKWKEPLLRLAAAYAVYALPPGPDVNSLLGTVTRNLAGLARRSGGLDVPDIPLLKAVLKIRLGRSLSRDDTSSLQRWADAGGVPAFRWGVSLATVVAEESSLAGRSLEQWFAKLGEIEERLCMTSAWTVWRHLSQSAG